MPVSPFPQGTALPNGETLGRLVRAVDPIFWIHMTRGRRRALLMTADFAKSLPDNLLAAADMDQMGFADADYVVMVSDGVLDVVDHLPRPTAAQGMAFAAALRNMPEAVDNAVYDEARQRLIPFPDPTLPSRDKAEVLGRYLTGGIEVRGDDTVALERILPKIDPSDLEAIVAASGLKPKSPIRSDKSARKTPGARPSSRARRVAERRSPSSGW